MAESKFSKIGWMGVGAMISSPITAFLVPLFSRLYEITGDSLTSSLAQLYPAIASGLSTIVPFLLGIIGGVLVIGDLVHRRQKKDHEPIVIRRLKPDVKLVDNLPQPSVLQYGKIHVKRSFQNSYGGVLESRYYYIEIINTNEGIEALNCRGDIRFEGNAYSTIWDKSKSDIISIAHRELLFLFEVLIFTKDSILEKRLYFDWDLHTIDEKAIIDYNDKLNKEMTVLVHSENVRYPTEAQSYKKTIQQIILEAVSD